MGSIIFKHPAAAAKALTASSRRMLDLGDVLMPDSSLMFDPYGDAARQAYFQQQRPPLQTCQRRRHQQHHHGQTRVRSQTHHHDLLLAQLQREKPELQPKHEPQLQHLKRIQHELCQQHNQRCLQFKCKIQQLVRLQHHTSIRQQRNPTHATRQLFVGGFSPALNSQQLRAAFELCGRVENAQVFKRPHTADPQPVASIMFCDARSAHTAIQALVLYASVELFGFLSSGVS
jgi:hypothetical protein